MADKNEIHIDPICGMEVEEDTAAGKSHYENNDYYFCSKECQNTFDLNPAQYATSVVPKS